MFICFQHRLTAYCRIFIVRCSCVCFLTTGNPILAHRAGQGQSLTNVVMVTHQRGNFFKLFYTVPTEWCVCYDAGRSFYYVNYVLFVNYAQLSQNVRLCTTNKRLDLEAPIFANMYFDKVSSPANFHSNRRHPWPSFWRPKIWIEYIGKCILHSSLHVYRHGLIGYVWSRQTISIATISKGFGIIFYFVFPTI